MIEVITVLVGVSVPCAAALYGFKLWLDRIHPEHKPDPSGKELLEALETHKKELKKEVDALAGRIAFKERPRLRE